MSILEYDNTGLNIIVDKKYVLVFNSNRDTIDVYQYNPSIDSEYNEEIPDDYDFDEDYLETFYL